MATVDLRSTDSGVAAKHPEDSSAAAGQSVPSATPAISGAGVTPAAAPARAPGAVASYSDVKPAVPGPPYLGRHDLAAEDKIRFFDRIAELVSSYCLLVHFLFPAFKGMVVLLMGVAPEAASNRLRLVAVADRLALFLSWNFFHWEHGSAPNGSSPRGCKQALAVGCSLLSAISECSVSLLSRCSNTANDW